jgi:hypothetical protein
MSAASKILVCVVECPDYVAGVGINTKYGIQTMGLRQKLQNRKPVMNSFYKSTSLIGAAVIVAASAAAQPVQISSFSANGQLTVSAPVGSDFSVEWSPVLGAGAVWSDRWDFLTAVRSTNTTTKLGVPMFYRVSCYTNGLLWPLKPGSSFVFAVSNALGETTMQSVKSLGKCYVPEFTNHYGVLSLDEVPVSGGTPGGTVLARSDDTGVWVLYNPHTHFEALEFFRGTVGMAMTNGENIRIEIEAVENVTVPAGTFTNCIRFRKTDLSSSDPNPYWYEWISPGMGTVKWADYYVDPVSAAPVVYLLQSYSGL